MIILDFHFWSAMAICKHLKWLQIADEKKPALINPDRMKRIVGELINPTVQRPSVLYFIDRIIKIQTLRNLFLDNNNIKPCRIDDLATLRIDNISFCSNYFIFFANSDASTTIIII